MLLNKHNVAVAKFASKSMIREEMACVLVKNGKTIATDAFRLVEVALPKADPTEYPTLPNGRTLEANEGENGILIRAKDLGKVKGVKDAKSLPILQNIAIVKNGEEHEAYSTNLTDTATFPLHIIEDGSRFPKYETIFDEQKVVAKISLNAAYLAEIAAVFAKMGSGHITLSLCGDYKPVIIESQNEKQPARALLMPLNR